MHEEMEKWKGRERCERLLISLEHFPSHRTFWRMRLSTLPYPPGPRYGISKSTIRLGKDEVLSSSGMYESIWGINLSYFVLHMYCTCSYIVLRLGIDSKGCCSICQLPISTCLDCFSSEISVAGGVKFQFPGWMDSMYKIMSYYPASSIVGAIQSPMPVEVRWVWRLCRMSHKKIKSKRVDNQSRRHTSPLDFTPCLSTSPLLFEYGGWSLVEPSLKQKRHPH